MWADANPNKITGAQARTSDPNMEFSYVNNWEFNALVRYLAHSPGCYNNGDWSSCTCDLMRTIREDVIHTEYADRDDDDFEDNEKDELWEDDDNPHYEIRSLDPLLPWLGHMRDCQISPTEFCNCGLHQAFPQFWRV